ncbi:hypothetical protein [Martelella soudanensis]|uniref:hypothetical protein n=1 Tax=unclassified Martelella TaxID=2629616 RepID=UPI0015DFD6B9|nr:MULTISPECIES: hypothetical protein [unclassified Martelella]
MRQSGETLRPGPRTFCTIFVFFRVPKRRSPASAATSGRRIASKKPADFGTFTARSRLWNINFNRSRKMSGIIYLVGLIVVVMFILSVLGLA